MLWNSIAILQIVYTNLFLSNISVEKKKDLSDSVQLCAQALCLEEMLNLSIPRGAFFYGETKRRLDVELNESLRKETLRCISRLHQVINAKKTPPAKYEKKCENCSLINWCMPACTNGSKSVNHYLDKVRQWAADEENES